VYGGIKLFRAARYATNGRARASVRNRYGLTNTTAGTGDNSYLARQLKFTHDDSSIAHLHCSFSAD
jgi:hypothetical protein